MEKEKKNTQMRTRSKGQPRVVKQDIYQSLKQQNI
jgi:hypothetical protein